MAALSGQRRSFLTRSELSKPNSLALTGGLMIASTFTKSKSPLPSPRQRIIEPPKSFLLQGTAKSLKPLPVRKSVNLGSLSISITPADSATLPGPTLCLSKSSSALILPPLKSIESRSVSPSSSSASRSHWPYTKRLTFKPRLNMGSRNLLILHFEGVLGDWLRTELWTKRPPCLHLRSTAIRGLQRLLQKFQVVLFIRKREVKSKRLLAHFQRFGVVFDAVYRSKNSWTSRPSQGKLPTPCLKYVQNYDQIYTDFNVLEVDKQCILVGSLRLCDEDISISHGHDLIYRRLSNQRHEIYVCGVPVSGTEGQNSPLTLLFPDPLSRDSSTGASFIEIAECICSLSDLLPRDEHEAVNWQDLYWLLKAIQPRWKTEVVQTDLFYAEIQVKSAVISPKTHRFPSIRTQNSAKYPQNVFIFPEVKGNYRYEVYDVANSPTNERKWDDRRYLKKLSPMDI